MFTRLARLDGATDDGSFSMTLATGGEASDGHVLNIAGGKIPDRMPLLVSHVADPSRLVGSITSPRKDLDGPLPRLRATGQIELEGEGEGLATRRDLSHMIAQGHIAGVSVRWDEVPGKSTKRTALPKDHPHFVDGRRETDVRKLNGIFFEEWVALEGSIVALPADREAMIGRALDTEGEVAEFWRAMADEAGPADVTLPTLVEIAALANKLRANGGTTAEILTAVSGEANIEDFDVAEIGGVNVVLPAALADQLREEREARQEPDEIVVEPEPQPDPDQGTESVDQPAPTAGEVIHEVPRVLTPAEIAGTLRDALAAARVDVGVVRDALLNKARGRFEDGKEKHGLGDRADT